jgi:tetratricopeptide (TPR) repeat protein
VASEQADRAWSDVKEFMEFLEDFVESPSAPQPQTMEIELGRLSPEARMLVWERLLALTPTSTDRNQQLVHKLMRDGAATVEQFRADIASMSAEGRAHAFELLTSDPRYIVRGIRWHAPPATFPPPSKTPTLDPSSTKSSFQTVADAVRTSVDVEWAESVSLIRSSMESAGSGDWVGAADSIRGAIAILERLSTEISTFYCRDLAVAYYHLEAYLGNAGDHEGAQAAIGRSLRLFIECQSSSDDLTLLFDGATALGSQAILFAEAGDFAEAVRCESAAVTALQTLWETDPITYESALAEHLAQLAMLLEHAKDLGAALSTIDRALALYGKIDAANRPLDLRFVEVARRTQARIRATVEFG